MNKTEQTKLAEDLHNALRHLVMARAEIITAEAILHPLVTEGKAPEMPSDLALEILNMYEHADSAHVMINDAERDWQQASKLLANIASGGQQALFPPEQRNGTGKQRVHIIGGVSDDDPNEQVDL